jgi:hypothetical protein
MRFFSILVLGVLLALISNAADANLIVDLRAVSQNGIPVSDPTHLTVVAGDQIVVDVWATITGTAPYKLLAAQGGILETPTATGVKGDMSWATNHYDLANYVYAAPFDLGSIPTNGRTNIYGDIEIPKTEGPNNGFGAAAGYAYLIPSEGMRLGHIAYTVKSIGDGSAAILSFDPAYNHTGAIWYENNVRSTSLTAGAYNAGTSITLVCPEPTTLVLVTMGAIGLIVYACRRNRKTA